MSIKQFQLSGTNDNLEFRPPPQAGFKGEYIDMFATKASAMAFIADIKKLGDMHIETAFSMINGHPAYTVGHNVYVDADAWRRKHLLSPKG
jgi:hypothetical protein